MYHGLAKTRLEGLVQVDYFCGGGLVHKNAVNA